MQWRLGVTMPPQWALVLRNGVILMLAIAAANFIGLPEGLFLALAILTVLETDLGGGVIAGRERIVGTLLGLLAVVITAGIAPVLPLPARVFSGLLLVRLFGFTAGLNNGFIVGGHVVAGSLLHHLDSWWDYAFWRTLMTILGVLIGVLVSQRVYSQRSASNWRERCRSWTEALADALLNMNNIHGNDRVYLTLREQRNALRRGLPQLVAEQSVTRSKHDDVRWAQEVLQHCSTVMSSCRDISGLLRSQLNLTPALTQTTQALQHLGSDRLRATGREASLQQNEWPLVRRQLNQAIETDLLQPCGPEPPSEDAEKQTKLFLASRLLLLADALERLAESPARKQQDPLI
jgi:uncharacterized membrane protein YccC